MKTLILILVLFSSSLFAETYTCILEQPHPIFGNKPYELFIDTGDSEEGSMFLFDENNELQELVIHRIISVGKIYANALNPFGLGKKDWKAYFTEVHELVIHGFFKDNNSVAIKTFRIDLKKENKPILLLDADLRSGGMSRGTCK